MIPSIILNNGVVMPQIGLGTYKIPKEKFSRTIAMAYEMGYRMFDTAWYYNNEVDLAKALKENGIKREDVFISTQINANAMYWGRYHSKKRFLNIPRRTVRQTVELSFHNLGGYADLVLIHWPYPIYLKMYKALSEMYKAERIKAIGVSSFLQPHLASLQEVSDVPPALNQFEISPLNTQKQLIGYCKKKGIKVEAMSTFSHYRSIESRKELIEEPMLLNIAAKKNRSVAQIILRWLVQQGIMVIPRSTSPEHLLENISLFDFELSSEEMAMIDSLDKGEFLNYDPRSALMNAPERYRI
jgi:diketogulonate reductase-like aldo/keto reductase